MWSLSFSFDEYTGMDELQACLDEYIHGQRVLHNKSSSVNTRAPRGSNRYLTVIILCKGRPLHEKSGENGLGQTSCTRTRLKSQMLKYGVVRPI
jgi:hypothetical protein